MWKRSIIPAFQSQVSEECVRSGLGRRGNNGVSRYPRYQKIFGPTENVDKNYRYFVAKMTLMQKLPIFLS